MYFSISTVDRPNFISPFVTEIMNRITSFETMIFSVALYLSDEMLFFFRPNFLLTLSDYGKFTMRGALKLKHLSKQKSTRRFLFTLCTENN